MLLFDEIVPDFEIENPEFEKATMVHDGEIMCQNFYE